MLTIDIHTHILPEHIPNFKEKFGYGGFIQLDHCGAKRANMVSDSGEFFRQIKSNCWDPRVRLQECEDFDVDVQVLSTVPVMFCYWVKPQDGLAIAEFLNDHIAQVVQQHPKQFVGLGTVPLQDTALAIRELERCVGVLGFPGVQIGSNVNNLNLSDPRLFDFFQAAQDLNACIFIHPWEMMGREHMKSYWLPWLVGMPAETARAICSLIFGGVMQRLPNLRLAFAHGGGAFPATLGRIEHGFLMRPDLCAVDNDINPREFLPQMVFDSLVHDKQTLQFLIDLVGVQRIALGSDYPFPLGELEPGGLINSMGSLSIGDRNRLLSGTALEWLGLNREAFI